MAQAALQLYFKVDTVTRKDFIFYLVSSQIFQDIF